MDFNLVVIAGRLVVAPERAGDSGARLLLTVESPAPTRRVDLLAVVVPSGSGPAELAAGDRIWVVGRLQRRFNSVTGRSTLQVMALRIEAQA